MMMDAGGQGSVLQISSEQLLVELLPNKGADIYSVIDRATGIDVLFKTPWGQREWAPPGADSQTSWLARYPGGWQQLIPNAGPARQQDGVELGYHGEAAVTPWSVLASDQHSAHLSVELLTVPLRLERTVRVTGSRISVKDVVQNLSPDPVGVRWVQHPAFGAPFIDSHCHIDTSARLFLSDAEIPGPDVDPNALTSFPSRPGMVSGNLREVAGPETSRAIFGALTDFPSDAWFSITSPTAGFGIQMNWDRTIFAHAWFWQECHATPGFPWYRRAYVVAVEPANVLPGEGSSGPLPRGVTPQLEGGAHWVSKLTLNRFDLQRGI